MKHAKYRIMRMALIAGCLYEVVAIARQIKLPYTQSPPTVSRIVRRVGANQYGKIAMWAWIGFIASHFAEPLEHRVQKDLEASSNDIN